MKLLKYALLATLLFICSLFSFNNAGAATLTESPANIAQGGTATATWSGIAAPTNRDWIALYAAGAADTSFIDWIYVSCSKSAGNAFANGSCNFPIPSSLSTGTYELRLFTNNSYTGLAKSNQFTVGPVSARFVDNLDGTITDTRTGLMWEKKTGSIGSGISCVNPFICPDQSNVNNVYVWAITSGVADGTLFTDFLARMNCTISSGPCGAGPYSDWRVPTLAELQTILATCPGGGQACIDPSFGPTQATYWSFTSEAGNPFFAWDVNFLNGSSVASSKVILTFFARAVRGGR